jgi:hypothetical protein
MKTKIRQALALAAALTLGAAAAAGAMDHSTMHGMPGGAPAAAPAEKPAHPGTMIRTAKVSGYTLTYTLIGMAEAQKDPALAITRDTGKLKSHLLMVYAVGPSGTPATDGKAGFLVVQPDKTEVKAMAMPMGGGFGADVDLAAKGAYKITTKIALADSTLVDEFVHTAKAPGSSTVAVVNVTCPIMGGAISPDGVPASLTREYKGQKIGFCCAGCPGAWDKLTDAEKDAALAKAMKPAK